MRVYLACTVRGDRSGLNAARAIATRLQQRGHDVFTTHLLSDDADEAESRMTEQEVFRRDLEWLSLCDVLVAEASGSTYGVGFEVGYVLGRAKETGQRVVLLYDRTRRNSISRLIAGNCHQNCTTIAYDSVADIEDAIDQHFAAGTRSR